VSTTSSRPIDGIDVRHLHKTIGVAGASVEAPALV
jgi:hypothetical protein